MSCVSVHCQVFVLALFGELRRTEKQAEKKGMKTKTFFLSFSDPVSNFENISNERQYGVTCRSEQVAKCLLTMSNLWFDQRGKELFDIFETSGVDTSDVKAVITELEQYGTDSCQIFPVEPETVSSQTNFQEMEKHFYQCVNVFG
jgi:hypothetical protein